MFNIDFNSPIHVHFIGIGGISMSGLAKILLDRHFTVSGSDAHESELTAELARMAAIYLIHSPLIILLTASTLLYTLLPSILTTLNLRLLLMPAFQL